MHTDLDRPSRDQRLRSSTWVRHPSGISKSPPNCHAVKSTSLDSETMCQIQRGEQVMIYLNPTVLPQMSGGHPSSSSVRAGAGAQPSTAVVPWLGSRSCHTPRPPTPNRMPQTRRGQHIECVGVDLTRDCEASTTAHDDARDYGDAGVPVSYSATPNGSHDPQPQ